ncbi:MAG: lysophospholipase [Clostridia bacterium]|nr:lysophospholipase [Clostridia bacterium]
MKFTESSFISASSADRRVVYSVYEPDDARPHAVLQISHGMCEYIGRYEDFARYLTAHGVIVCGNDHIGHGRSIGEDSELGYIPRGGAEYLVEDVHKLTALMKSRFPDLPYFLLGHSMGSFVARLYLSKYGAELDGAVIMGTGGPGNPTGIAKLLARLIAAFRGGRHRSKLINSIAFGSYNARCGKGCAEYAWLTRNEEIVARYTADKYCNFVFTCDAFHTLFDMLGRVSKKSWATTLPRELPILIVSGEQDPVGGYGKGVQTVFERIKAAGVRDVRLKMYLEDRHEVLNELDRETVYADILAWMRENISERYI